MPVEQLLEGVIPMSSLEILIEKIDQMATLQTKTIEQQSFLTQAVTTLTVQIEHFEKLRSENNTRMDKIEKSLFDHKEEDRNREDKLADRIKDEIKRVDDQHRSDTTTLWTQVNCVASRVDQIKPIIAILTVVLTAGLLFAFGFKS